ncbi:MAG TPA: sialate O-acetylesterase [Firmicutes bacterium]|jgi:sialate O-acetylesterase|nr:sialate O-acetylesterase [Bacillota bacterium]
METRTEPLFLSPILSDGMVLQRETPVKIWGQGVPNEEVRVAFRDKVYTTTTDAHGTFRLVLEPMTPGCPFTMQISQGQTEISIGDILVGDVWLLGGQSNMELPIRRTLDLFEEEVKTARNPFIRQFTVPMLYDFHGPRTELSGGEWKAVTPETVLDFSAVGYFFAQALYEKYKLPIGLIQTAVGGTPVEAWMSEEVIKRIGGYEELLAQCKDHQFVQRTLTSEQERMERWYRQLNREDQGCQDGANPWSKPDYDDTAWSEFRVPALWTGSELETVQGAVWFRKKFEVPAEMLRYEGLLRLGAIIDGDDTYLNGVLVGKTDYKYPPRKYMVPPGVLRAGVNTLAVRVICNRNTGGFMKDKAYSLTAGPYTIDLTGPWKYKIGAVMPVLPQLTFFQYKPTGVYNGMIAPLKHYALKGFLWYQGESNTHHPDNYQLLFTEMIKNWRATWQQGELPFLYVQLPNFLASFEQTPGSNWARLREEQRRTLSVPNTGMAVTIDLGEYNDLHPQNKKDVGRRLALCARQLVYKEKIVAQGPSLKQMEVKGKTIELRFTGIGSGLVAKDGPLGGFEVCGDDRKFHPATAEIEDDRIRVFSPLVEKPVGLRYAWADHPTEANLYNREGLPASPFEAYR